MRRQLERIASDCSILMSLLKWLHARCLTPWSRNLFESAVKRFLKSKGRDIALVGILMRDTQPTETDLRSAGGALTDRLPDLTRVDLIAWYLPIPINTWPHSLRGRTP